MMLVQLRDLLRQRAGIDVRRVRRLDPDGVQRYSNFGEEEIVARELARIGIENSFCVDVGAGDGRTSSNSYALFRAGWRGLAVEYDAATFIELATSLGPCSDVSLLRARVTPANVREILAAAGAPQDLDVLSLDIDGYDHSVLKEVLAAYRPRLVIAEINEKIPPPVLFSVVYSEDYNWREDHFYGQSIAMLEHLASTSAYALVGLEYNNAFLVPDELAAVRMTAAEAYATGYLSRPDRLRRLPWNRDMEPLLEMSPEECAAEVRRRFSRYQGQFVCVSAPELLGP